MERETPLLLSGKVRKKGIYHSFTVQLSDELKDAIVLQSMTDCLESFKKDLKSKVRVFDYDPTKDKKIIKEHIDALEKIIKLYQL
jgi:hypothetical protein